MAGILASSASKTMTSGDTATDQSVTGYVTGERIVLTTSPTGTDYQWGQSIPTGSASGRSALSDDTAQAPTFIPDAAGIYVITADVDGTTYVLRIVVEQVAITTPREVLRLTPKSDASVPTPAVGVALYYSSDQGTLCIKDTDGNVSTVDVTAT